MDGVGVMLVNASIQHTYCLFARHLIGLRDVTHVGRA